MKRKLSFLSLVALFLMPSIATAEAIVIPEPPFKLAGKDIFSIVGAVISNLISIAWVIFGGFAVCMFIYAGFLFLNAKGDLARVKDARNALVWGSVGVGIGLLAQVLPWAVRWFLGF